jgi:phage terminase large subunit
MHRNGYTSDKASVWLPHDGKTQDRVYDVSYQSAFAAAGYDVEVIPNQGKGAAMQRIEAIRRWLGSCWFNEETCKGGIDALGWYHEKKDDNRDIGLGPEHDWSSHGADAFGLLAIAAEELFDIAKDTAERVFHSVGWQG